MSNLLSKLSLQSSSNLQQQSIWARVHIDLPLMLSILTLLVMGLLILYSASTQNVGLIEKQTIRLGFALFVMLVLAQIPPHYFKMWSLWVYMGGLILLIAVLFLGHVGKGAQRWLDLGFIRFQPSEVMKLAVPLMLARYFSEKSMPPNANTIFVAIVITMVPVLLIAKQPDLGTSLLVASSGFFILFLSGISFKFFISCFVLGAAMTPVLWFFMHDYQRQRVFTFLNPENDPLGTGYHIIQSKIAIGSGGWFGKGWFNGTQSHLQFLPERSTDFIFAVFSEEFGLIGSVVLLLIYLLIIFRGLYISAQAQDTFTRLTAGSLTLIFFIYVFINIGMVSGLLPVVGIPLPLVSYGGTSMVTIMASFGILMSIHTHRKLLAN